MGIKQDTGKGFLLISLIFFLIVMGNQPVSALTVSSLSVDPFGTLNPGDTVKTSFNLEDYGVFPEGEIQFFSDLDNPAWNYTIIVNGVENLRPVIEGHNFTISGFELSYKSSDVVSVRMTLDGVAPSVDENTYKTLIRITEYDANGKPVNSTIFEKTALVISHGGGDLISQVGVFRPASGNWYLDYNKSGVVDNEFHFGTTGDVPVTGDWDGDGISDVGVFRPANGNWYMNYNKTGVSDKEFHFGTTGDIPVVGDWDGNGISDVGVFRPANGNWYLDTTKTGVVNTTFHFGTSGDVPVTGDWDGDVADLCDESGRDGKYPADQQSRR